MAAALTPVVSDSGVFPEFIGPFGLVVPAGSAADRVAAAIGAALAPARTMAAAEYCRARFPVAQRAARLRELIGPPP
jgi:hypothetical protein